MGIPEQEDRQGVLPGLVVVGVSADLHLPWFHQPTKDDNGAVREPVVASILDVSAEGDVMPQKSTYFYPKALTGLVFNPHEW